MGKGIAILDRLAGAVLAQKMLFKYRTEGGEEGSHFGIWE